MRKVRVTTSHKTYDIEIESGLLERLPGVLRSRCEGRKLALVSDSRVFELYGRTFLSGLRDAGFEAFPVVFEEGERNKNLATLSAIYGQLADSGFTRSDYVAALGGGVTGDMAGLAAATFLRGTGFIQIPTTLLAMVDSSVGGKVAVDMKQGKNLVGAFYQPDAVFIDPSLLSTLDDRTFSDGMAELLKHAFIMDRELCARLFSFGSRAELAGVMDEIVLRSCAIKRDVVQQDERDDGIRRILNFGHTIGHALEKLEQYRGLTHGEAVSVGMVFTTRMTERMGLTSAGTAQRIAEILTKYRLPVDLPKVDPSALIDAMKIDKKARSGRITVAYIRDIGEYGLMEMCLDEWGERVYEELGHQS
jgi:3-dehydroquinate synthase